RAPRSLPPFAGPTRRRGSTPSRSGSETKACSSSCSTRRSGSTWSRTAAMRCTRTRTWPPPTSSRYAAGPVSSRRASCAIGSPTAGSSRSTTRTGCSSCSCSRRSSASAPRMSGRRGTAAGARRAASHVKRIGFLSFGHWNASPYSQVRSGADALIQSIELAEAVEALGADGAYFRVHHFAQQLASPFPLLAAIGARTSRIEIGTAVIDMRYENPFYMVEDAGAADLIAGGRLQLGISRGSPEQVIDGFRHFGYQPAEGGTDADLGRRHAEVF